MAGPIEQFEIKPLLHLFDVGGVEIVLTNSAAHMGLAVAIIFAFLMLATRKGLIIPSRFQSSAELLYVFVRDMLRENVGQGGMRFFPLVFSLFMFVLVANLIGMFPYAFTATSQIILTFSLAMTVFLTVTIYGLILNGFGFFRLFLPSGVPLVLAPIVIPIEMVSYLSRPISHSVRLFAVMLAGHITLKVFAGFVADLSGAGAMGLATAILPLIMTVALTGLELLMSLIQAYIFAMLTCMYLNDALHPAH
ncbi:ATP synthase subunit a [Kaistia sp. 32K]|uniref:F0F1 ATP synthase subunit A n=1 Tax=Kaistia sp. 32K TaxID=2795690 RepID=UPI0019169A3B|nr:F0F1 ATP synthase subunit A [Kaistia sp. 32K]BCP52677.1 ATP synthase subunit a [Kaistia sp. 32K]